MDKMMRVLRNIEFSFILYLSSRDVRVVTITDEGGDSLSPGEGDCEDDFDRVTSMG
ncbi:hypothetical protein KSB_43580 [Ktedonobacter robiniae]|uniref:Uncharacterized protein n=1 Tax=Ktedonobacter robiniae TaxID=2778365 RepID=A0ABQ3UT63_9CHLR|nr:hypothetical protein KSB_43580 [Ktedonobacter robiniae]